MRARLGWMLLAGLPLPRPATEYHALPLAAHRAAGTAPRVNLWTDRDEPYARGEGVRVYLSTDEPAYLTVFRVDTDGQLRILFPREPWGDARVPRSTFEVTGSRGGRSFMVDDYPGVGYLFAVASTRPFDYDDITRGDYWDYRLIGGGHIQEDPYVVLTGLARRIAPQGSYDYDIVPYYVERRYAYPRFVCYDCHAYASYSEWDPYRTACSRFRMVIYDDPRYYPYRSTRGDNIVVERSASPGPRYVFRDADPGADYVTHLQRRPDPENYRERREAERTSRDVGGHGSVPVPGLSVPPGHPAPAAAPRDGAERPLMEERRRVARPGQRGDTGSELEGRRPAEQPPGSTARRRPPPPRSTGEPELRRRKP